MIYYNQERRSNMSNNLKYLKIILSLIIVILLFITFDYLYLSITKKPLIIISNNTTEQKLSGLIYDIYNCQDNIIIKQKGAKFTCPITPTIPDTTNQDKNTSTNSSSSSSSKNIDSLPSSSSTPNPSKKDPINKYPNSSTSSNQSKKITIIDKSDPNTSCASAIEYYYEDNEYKYYFTCIKSPNIYIKIDNEEYNIKYALNNHIVTIEELESSGFKPLKESKNSVTK